MNKLNIGDYVRTPQGIIAKIINIQEDTGQYFLNGNAVSLESKNYIADKNITIGENFKHSPNIIDLIEENDLIKYRINGDLYVSEVKGHPEFDKYKLHIEYLDTIIDLNDLSIVSIITHEQFENISYKVGE